MKGFARHKVLHRSGLFACVHVEIKNFFPHRRKKTQMPLLPGIFLRDLQLDGLVCFFQAAEERRNRFAHLEINRPMFDLDDYVVVELAVKRMKIVVGGPGPIVLGIGPIEMMVVNKRAIKDDSVVRRKGACNHVGGIGRRAAIRRGTEPPLRIRLDDHARKIRNDRVKLVKFFPPPFGNARVRRIERIQATDHLWAAEIDGDRKPNSPRTKHIRNACELRQKVILKNMGIGIHIVDRASVDSDGSKQARVFACARKVGAHITILEKNDGPAYPRSMRPSRLSHWFTQRIGAEGCCVSCKAETLSSRAILLSNANTP